MKLADFVCFEATIPEQNARDPDGVIANKANRREIIKAVMEREKEASTAMGKGVAVPHVKHPAVKDVVAAIGQSSVGIGFSSLDKQPVYSVILLISPADDPDRHLQAMENIFKHLQHDRFRKFLRQSQTTEQIEDLLREVDENPFLQ